MNEGCNSFLLLFLIWTLSKFKSGTVHVAQVEVSVNQRGSVVEVLGHVIQPVRLHSSDALVVVLDPQRHLDCVVLHLAFSDGRVVVQSQQIHTCRTRTENKTSSSAPVRVRDPAKSHTFPLGCNPKSPSERRRPDPKVSRTTR